MGQNQLIDIDCSNASLLVVKLPFSTFRSRWNCVENNNNCVKSSRVIEERQHWSSTITQFSRIYYLISVLPAGQTTPPSGCAVNCMSFNPEGSQFLLRTSQDFFLSLRIFHLRCWDGIQRQRAHRAGRWTKGAAEGWR